MQFPISIIIPTHQRANILRMTLEALQKQTFKDFEVIVVSDGPDSKTDDLMTGLEWNFEFQYFAIPKSQQGIARNRGVEKARGKYVLLIGDDILLASDAVEKHLAAHEKIADGRQESFSAVLGFTTWDPTINITPRMRWMEKTGLQFGYPKIQKYAHDFISEDQQQWFTYTSHISLSSRKLFQHQFREDVSLYGWEDIEWGKRLADAGIPLYYEPDAVAYHHHSYSDAEIRERSKLLGESAIKMEQLVPEMKIAPRGFKRIAYWLLSLIPINRGRHCRAFLRGMKS